MKHFLLRPYIFLIIFTFLLSFCTKKEIVQVPDPPGPPDTTSNPPRPVGDKPNIILILGDDIGYEIPTVDGGQSYSTPNIDRMAQEGMRFTRFHASPLCSPSRFMLLTGKYNFRNYYGWGVMDPANKTISDLLEGVNYKTYVTGKWQLGGGQASAYGLGFQNYILYNPFTKTSVDNVPEGASEAESRYKNPVIYEHAGFLSDAEVNGKYGDDIFTDSVSNFIDHNKTKPFFIYFPICLAHYPFCPTPDDADFKQWNPGRSTPDKKYFPSMIAYMDKKIGEVLDKVQSDSIANNTVVIFIGDNGTDARIASMFKGYQVIGGKGHSNEYGTRVPMIMSWPGKIAPASISNALLDLTDIMPTIASLAGTSIPSSFGITDGTDFTSVMYGSSLSVRGWIFCHYDPDLIGNPTTAKRWIQDTAYKLYDNTGLFYHYATDLKERSPLTILTAEEQKTKSDFQKIMSTMHN